MKIPCYLLAGLAAAAVAPAATAPTGLAGQVLELQFHAAQSCTMAQGKTGPWVPATISPLLVQFPADAGNSLTIKPQQQPQREAADSSPHHVLYAPMGDMAVITIRSDKHYITLTLNFSTPGSGTATLNLTEGEDGWLARDVSFTIRPADDNAARVKLPAPCTD